MVLDVSTLVGKASAIGGTVGTTLLYVIIGLFVLIVIFLIGLWIWWRRRWNLEVEFKLTRSDGRITNAEWGKGYFNAKRGVVFVKRPTMGRFARGTPIKIFDIRRYIQGTSIITVIQVGPDDFRPVLNDSWNTHIVKYKDDKTGEIKEVKEGVLDIKIDTGLNKAWRTAWDSASKKAYSITSLLQQFATPIAIGIVIICCFVGFAILWTKIPKCGGLILPLI